MNPQIKRTRGKLLNKYSDRKNDQKKEAFRLFPFLELDLGFNFFDPLIQSRFDFFHHC